MYTLFSKRRRPFDLDRRGRYDQRFQIERFSNECRKTKTKVIIPANHNKHKLSNEPIRTRSKYISLAPSAGKRARASHNWFEFHFFVWFACGVRCCLGWV